MLPTSSAMLPATTNHVDRAASLWRTLLMIYQTPTHDLSKLKPSQDMADQLNFLFYSELNYIIQRKKILSGKEKLKG